MNVEEFANSIVQTVKERLSSPLTGALALSWTVWNYKAVLVLLSTKKVEDKILIIDHLLYQGRIDAIKHLVVGPLVTAFLVVGLYPMLSLAGYKLWANWQLRFRKVQQALDKERLITKDEYEKWIQESYERTSRHAREIEQKNALIASQKATIEELNSLVSSLKQEGSQPVQDAGGSSDEDDVQTKHVMDKILNNRFVLNFNPKLRDEGRKVMLFGKSGTVLAGRNENESSWRAVNGWLEFLNSKGEVHNRFAWHPAINAFIATNEADLPAIPNQRMIVEN